MNQELFDYYAKPGRFSDLGDSELATASITGAVDAVQGLLVYDVVAQPFYGVELSPQQADAIHERDSGRLLALAREVDSRPLTEPRPPSNRVGARCHSFSKLTVAVLRAAGLPARARCGFGAYFRPGFLEDHWVAEWWNATSEHWQMVDAQLDATWLEMIGFQGNPFDITSTQFVTAGHAWQAWRKGELDAGTCGLSAIDEHGAHWIAHNLRLDLASLNKVEMLPWDLWGAGWELGTDPETSTLELFDQVADLTVEPDTRFSELCALYESDASLRMSGAVFNVSRGCTESV